ncbi:hypothetical protein [Paenibacillus sp. DMB20]|uniref:hypothetical protein n=1 Tax=Paenibacillus sp. DMB20 TaxID=1642570 RepID=UPI000B18B7AB|nr:hypothetical protein [Paenibacillus sp. DMB20]
MTRIHWQTKLVHEMYKEIAPYEWLLVTSIVPKGDFFLFFRLKFARSSGEDETIPEKR